MPIYEYQCSACGHTLDALQKFSEPLLTVCPACSQPTLGKLVSAPSFQLKGTGWYATDFKTQPAASKPANETQSTPTETKTNEPKTTPAKDASSK
jgi:putative FmdB family regulatory protein